ncbi:hypothetical protein [Paenibacillus sp. SC116]|uniref:hypothetical protein n=1 Tax=Paenibacillus sp. SC116 TaxID=2968986 RepID=UPI00215A4CC3|nr:hypothetical protein [Paenibacillus sp. SC116]
MQLYMDFYNKQGQWVSANIKDIHEDNGMAMMTTYRISGVVPNDAAKATAYLLVRSNSDNGAGSIQVSSASFGYGVDPNLIYNGHLQISNEQHGAEGWIKHGGVHQNSIYNRLNDQGNYVQEIKSSHISSGAAISGITQLIEVEPNKNFKVSGTFKNVELKGAYTQLYVDFLDRNGAYIGANVTPYHSVTIGESIEFVNHGVVPAQAVSAKIYALIRGEQDNSSGTIQVDNLAFIYDDSTTSVNGDFNVYHMNDNTAALWSPYIWTASKYQLQLVKSDTGGISQFMKGSGIQTHGTVGIYQRLLVTPHRKYDVSTTVRVHELKNAKVQLYVDVFDKDWRHIQANIKEHNQPTGNQSIQISNSGDIPANAAYAHVYVLIRSTNNDGEGAVTVDNVQFNYK